MKTASQNLHKRKISLKFQCFHWVTIDKYLTRVKEEGGVAALPMSKKYIINFTIYPLYLKSPSRQPFSYS